MGAFAEIRKSVLDSSIRGRNLSPRTLAMVSKRVHGVEVSTDTVSENLGAIEEKALQFLTRPLEKRYWALFIDGTNFRIQSRWTTAKEPSLVVLGVDENNRMSLLAVEPGTKDNVDAWEAVFSELSKRGLDMSAVRIGIMDGLPGLEKLFRETFPNAVTARCWVHALRNAMAKTPARLRDVLKNLAHGEVLVAFTALRLEFGWQRTPVNSSHLESLGKWRRQNQIESTMESLIH